MVPLQAWNEDYITSKNSVWITVSSLETVTYFYVNRAHSRRVIYAINPQTF